MVVEQTKLNLAHPLRYRIHSALRVCRDEHRHKRSVDDAQVVRAVDLQSERIDNACTLAGRSTDEVQLLLATKTVDPSRIALAISAGYPLIAENKIQELKDKAEDLAAVPHVNHFIGHLQSNKIKELLRYNVSCLQSLDRLSLAQKLQQRLTFENKTLDVMIQVNTSGEKSKFGVAPANALDLEQVQNVSGILDVFVKHYPRKAVKEELTTGLLGESTAQEKEKRTLHTDRILRIA